MNSKKKKYENMTPLEALEWIDSYSEDDVYHNITNEVNIIKKALSRIEQLEKENQGVKDDNTRLWHGLEYANNENAKLKKVLDILKEYHLKVMFNETTDKAPYILFNPECDGCVVITQEEYELLKEVLENEC